MAIPVLATCNNPIRTYSAPALHVSTDVSKLGASMRAIAKVPGAGYVTRKDGRAICNVKGTCSGTCPGCYAIKSFVRNLEGYIRNCCENTLLCEDPRALYFALRDYIRENPANEKGELFRLNQAGDFSSADEIEVYEYVAENDGRDFTWYGYTKNWDALREYMNRHNWEKPASLNILLSECADNPAPDDLREHFPVCAWDMGTDECAKYADLPHCPAVSKPDKPGGRGHNTGVTCDRCKLCTRGVSMAIYNH